jgi:hypothetical protein
MAATPFSPECPQTDREFDPCGGRLASDRNPEIGPPLIGPMPLSSIRRASE